METLKLNFFAAHGKTSYLCFLGADFRAPKAVTDVKSGLY